MNSFSGYTKAIPDWFSFFPRQSVSQSISQTVGRSFSQSVGRSVGQSVSQSVGQSASQLICLLVFCFVLFLLVSQSVSMFVCAGCF